MGELKEFPKRNKSTGLFVDLETGELNQKTSRGTPAAATRAARLRLLRPQTEGSHTSLALPESLPRDDE